MSWLSPTFAYGTSYLVGSIPTGYLLLKWLKRIDVRTVGSGSIGATNVTRVAGSGAGRLVFLLDLSKGLMAAWGISSWLVPSASPAFRLSCGLAAILGHVFPVWLGFKGGKGVATMIGVLIATMPMTAGVALVVWAICFLMWRYVSVASLAAVATVPLTQWLTHRTVSEVLLGIALTALVIFTHRENIQRLREGREHRFGTPRP